MVSVKFISEFYTFFMIIEYYNEFLDSNIKLKKTFLDKNYRRKLNEKD